MAFLDIFRRKVQCLTCKERHYKRDCYSYTYSTWAGESVEYECKVCDVTRKFEGKPLKTWAVRVDEALRNHRIPIGMM
jgi:hypothetical protein